MSTRERKRSGSLPKHVLDVQRKLSKLLEHDLKPIADKLIGNGPDLVRMWKQLYKCGATTQNGYYDDLWVWAFLEEAGTASARPTVELLSEKRKQALSEEIEFLASKLSNLLTDNGLDAHLIYIEGPRTNGFCLYESATDRVRLSVGESRNQMLNIATGALPMISEYCREVIAVNQATGTSVRNALAIRFARLMAVRNHDRFGDALTGAIATATNAIYETNYSASDIMNLLSR